MHYISNPRGDVSAYYYSRTRLLPTYTYDAFGNQTEASGTDPFRYSGEYYDAESGFIYLRNRYYDPSIGRFITEDPARDGLNWYAYCENNPVTYTDPTGMFDWNTIYKFNAEYNPEIKVLQNELKYNGYYSGKVDGYFGAATEKAVKRLQMDRGLEVDGIVGIKTWSTLGLRYRTQQDIDAGVLAVTIGAKQYFDVSKPVTSAVESAKSEFASHYLDIGWFIKKVKNAGEWNIKRDANVWAKTLGISENSYNTTMIFYGRPVLIDDIGNITYGYLGAAAGFSDMILKGGSMGYHILNHGFSDLKNEFADERHVQLGVNWYNGEDIRRRFSAQ